jgi:hypothetical protein
VEVLVVGGLYSLVTSSAVRVLCESPETWFLGVAWGTFETSRNDSAVVGEVDELGRGGFGFVLKLVDRWL